MYTTLEGKQMQVMRLEKLVKLLEDQQDRAQAQRIRFEHRIAQLEVSLREKSRNDRYVMRKYLRKPRPGVINGRLSRAFPCESERTLLKASAAPYRYFSRHVSPTESSGPPPRGFNLNDWYRVTSDKEEAFICERCRRKVNEKFKGDVIRHVENPRVRRGSLYGWLMDSSVLEAFGEPTSRLNEFHGEVSSEEDVDCLYGIVNPIAVHNKNCNRDTCRYRAHYC